MNSICFLEVVVAMDFMTITSCGVLKSTFVFIVFVFFAVLCKQMKIVWSVIHMRKMIGYVLLIDNRFGLFLLEYISEKHSCLF